MCVIHNPVAGAAKRRKLGRVLHALRRGGAVVAVRDTRFRGDAETLTQEAARAGFDMVIAAGGDGTVNEVLNGLLALPEGARRVALGFIPLGTANVLAHETGMGTGLGAIVRTLLAGRRLAVTPSHLSWENGSRWFLLMAGAGLDGAIVEAIDTHHTRRKRRFGKLAYVVEALAQAAQYSFPRLSVAVHGGARTEGVMAVALGGQCYGGPFVAVPDGALSSPEGRMVVLKRPGWRGLLRYAVALGLGKLSTLHDVAVPRGQAFVIDGPDWVPVEADGDFLCRLPVRIERPGRTVDLIVP